MVAILCNDLHPWFGLCFVVYSALNQKFFKTAPLVRIISISHDRDSNQTGLILKSWLMGLMASGMAGSRFLNNSNRILHLLAPTAYFWCFSSKLLL